MCVCVCVCVCAGVMRCDEVVGDQCFQSEFLIRDGGESILGGKWSGSQLGLME